MIRNGTDTASTSMMHLLNLGTSGRLLASACNQINAEDNSDSYVDENGKLVLAPDPVPTEGGWAWEPEFELVPVEVLA